jgi:hypothetical protein
MCSESIKYLDVDRRKFVTLLSNNQLYGLSDLKFTDGENFIFSKMAEKNEINFHRNNNFFPLTDRVNMKYSVEWVDRISKIDNTFYYFDKKNKILYSLENDRNTVVLDMKATNWNDQPMSITNFYVNSKNDIYFIDTPNHRIFRYYDGNFHEQSFGFDITYPNDLTIYRNLLFILSDRYIQAFDMYNDNYSKVTPYISANSKYISDVVNNTNFLTIDENTVKTDEFDVISYTGIDKIKLLNPSFLIFFKNYGSELSLEKFNGYDSILNGESVYQVTDDGSMVYGKLYYEDYGELRVRTVSCRLAKKD